MRRVVGSGSKAAFCKHSNLEAHRPKNTSLHCAPRDQIVTAGAAVTIAEIQECLARCGQCLPIRLDLGQPLGGFPGTVGGLVATNMPHALSSQYGSPKEWVLHMEVLFQGEQAQSGAKVVKSVAGYDVHKLFVGSWGVLGPINTVTFRTYPLNVLSQGEAVTLRDLQGGEVWILRTLASELDQALNKAQGVYAFDRPSCTIWSEMRPEEPSEGWIIGPAGYRWSNRADKGMQIQIKRAFDPEGEWE
ncbi:MAG: FAD-binding oxidoreductase [Chthonomonadaceae bacterium]|nr:FAD-binding oxidoreductase [Chthonomonadaceae bacterium]